MYIYIYIYIGGRSAKWYDKLWGRSPKNLKLDFGDLYQIYHIFPPLEKEVLRTPPPSLPRPPTSFPPQISNALKKENIVDFIYFIYTIWLLFVLQYTLGPFIKCKST